MIRKISILFIVFFIFLGSLGSGIVEAKSEKTLQYEKFKDLKMNSSVESVAKVIYGKKYKKELCEEEKDINLLCYDYMEAHNKRYKNKKIRYYNYTFKFFPGYDSVSEKLEYRMNLRFKSKDDSKVLKLVEKKWEDFDTLNTHDVYNNKKIKTGMTTTQLDKIMEGKGIGPYEAVRYKDYSKVGYQTGEKKPVFYEQYKTLYYTVMSQDWSTLYKFRMEYDHKKKAYDVVYVLRFG